MVRTHTGRDIVKAVMNSRVIQKMILSSREIYGTEAVTGAFERDDLPGTTYDSIQEAINAVTTQYGSILTRDVTISCIKEYTEVRDKDDPNKESKWRRFTGVIHDFNKDSVYTLTLDGTNLYTIDGHSLGGIWIHNADNIYIKNIIFRNCGNMVLQRVPEEISAIYSVGLKDSKVKNLVIENVNIYSGYVNPATGNLAYSDYGIDTKLTSNVIINNSVLNDAGAYSVLLTDVDIVEITNNTIKGLNKAGLAHPALLTISGAKYLKLADNSLTGNTYVEFLIALNNIETIDVLRNKIFDTRAQVFSIRGANPVILNVVANLFYKCILASSAIYLRFFLGASVPVRKLNLNSNTFFVDGDTFFQSIFKNSLQTEVLESRNNIIINSSNRLGVVFDLFDVGSYIASNNLYKNIDYVTGIDNESNTMFGNKRLTDWATEGSEINSTQVEDSVLLLDIEVGGSTYKLINALSRVYLADSNNLAEFDIDYKYPSTDTTVGAYNLNGVIWSDDDDISIGYSGLNIRTGDTFTHEAVYTVPSDDVLLITIKNKKKYVSIRTKITSTNLEIIRYGTAILATPLCVVNDHDMYVEDTNYSIMIEKNDI